MTPWVIASLDPGGMVGRIYVGDHQTLLHTKYISVGLMVLEKKIFKDFVFHYKSMGANDPRGMTSLDPKGLNCRIYVVDHYTLLHNKYISCGPDGFREEDLLSFSHYMSRPSGHGKFRPLGFH